MRVAVVAEKTAHHEATDATLRISRLAELLAARNHEITVFCAQWWEGSPEEFVSEDVTYRRIVEHPGVSARRLFTDLPGPLRSFDPDVIHAVHANPYAVLAAKIAGSLSRVPLVVDWYEAEELLGWRGRAHRLAVRAPDIVVTPSHLVKTTVRELGRSAEDIDIIPNWIDMDLIRSIEPEEIGDIVYSRSLDADANLASLLLALAELRDVDWKTVVIGEGPKREQYERQAQDLRIGDRVQFVGEQSLERRLAIFKGAHVAVHTALRAPFATDFLRALACGCVGIAEYQADSSATELIEHYERGFRTTSDDQLVDAIRRSADLPKQDVDEHFASYDETEFLERYLSCYRTVQEEYGIL